MSDIWFHATPDGGRIGPIRAEDLSRLFQTGGVQGTTPVWRESMADWVPLSSVASQLGLRAMPPPLPGLPQPPPRRGMHWIWIVLILFAGLAVPVLAVLAAVAIPAYNDYRLRAGVGEVFAMTAPLRQAVEHAAAEGHPCPITSTPEAVVGSSAFSNPDLDAARSALLAHPKVAGVTTAESAREARGQCEIVVQLDGFERAGIDGEVLIWSLDPVTGGWSCSGTLQRRYLPTSCRA